MLPPDSLQEHNRRQLRYYEAKVKRRMLPRDTPYLRRHVDELIRFGNLVAGERVLEVGCGMGRYTLYLAQRGIRVEGLELSSFLLDRLRSFDAGRYRIPLYCTDVIDARSQVQGVFDAVIGFFVLHHLHDLERSFGAMADLIKPGGRIIFLEPNPYNPLYYIQILFSPDMTWQGDKGIVRMRWNVISQAMGHAGFRQPSMCRFGFFPPFLANRLWGASCERALEGIRVWSRLLPFQIFRAEKA
jgi:SAM-dependent methyltransferase